MGIIKIINGNSHIQHTQKTTTNWKQLQQSVNFIEYTNKNVQPSNVDTVMKWNEMQATKPKINWNIYIYEWTE